MTGLLFAAFAFFAVAQAATVRNGGQSAADAAALAAAQDDRDRLFDGFLDDVADGGEGDEGGSWKDWLVGIGDIGAGGCGEADHFAGRNRSDVLSCDPVTRGADNGYAVRVETRFDTGSTLVPGTGHKRGRATATAVVKPRCEVDEGADGIRFECDGEEFGVDPDEEDTGLEASDLFSVVLVE